MSNRIADIVRMYRERRIEGDFVDLVPFTLVDADNVVAMRNREKNRHFLNQTCIITTASQARWYKSYLERFDDIYWSIYNKQNQFIGTVRIYDIRILLLLIWTFLISLIILVMTSLIMRMVSFLILFLMY